MNDQFEDFANLLFEILNNSNVYIVVLDRTINIRFINAPLANRLGFENIDELIGRCWLDFIPEKIHETLKTVHAYIFYNSEDDYREYTNEILPLDKISLKVKWYNTVINHKTFWTFSFGLPLNNSEIQSKASIRADFKNMIESDKTVIKSLKEFSNGLPEQFNLDETCKTTE